MPTASSLANPHEGTKLDAGYRLDMVVENSIVIEIKAVDALTRLHDAQMLTGRPVPKQRCPDAIDKRAAEADGRAHPRGAPGGG